jgi:hypothetical protein
MSEPSPATSKSQWVQSAVGVMVVAVAARLWIVRDGFWLDEIWSWTRLEAIDSLWDVLTKKELKHDNNHPLISMWMHLVGDRDRWVIYRIPSLVAGLVTVFLAMDRARGVRGAVFPGAMFAVSFFMILYGTEARGYALAVCFALGAYRILERSEAEEFRLGYGAAVGFWAMVVFGFLSHLIAVHFFAGVFAWTGVRLLRRVSFGVGIARMAFLHGVPIVFFGWMYLEFVRELIAGGASNVPLMVTVQDVFSWTTGMPNEMLFASAAMVVVVGLAIWELVGRGREGSYQWIVLPCVALIAPLGSLLMAKEEGLLSARFFLIGVAFVLLYAGRGLARLHARGGGAAASAILVLVVFAIGNAVREVRFVHGGGRGQYLEAVRFVAENSPQTFWMGSDMDFRNGNVLGYYRRFVRPGQVMRYRKDAPSQPQGPDWYLVHTIVYPEWGEAPPRPSTQLRGGQYALVRTFPHFGPSGFTWHLYARRR